MKPENFENALNELPTGDDIYNCTCKSCVDGSIKRMTRAPVTDAQRWVDLVDSAIACASGTRATIHLTRAKQLRDFLAALSAPVAQVDVDALIDEVVEKIVSPKEHAYNALLVIAAINETLDHITAHYHLTPKTQEAEG